MALQLSMESANMSTQPTATPPDSSEALQQLVAKGYREEDARAALAAAQNNLDLAYAQLLVLYFICI